MKILNFVLSISCLAIWPLPTTFSTDDSILTIPLCNVTILPPSNTPSSTLTFIQKAFNRPLSLWLSSVNCPVISPVTQIVLSIDDMTKTAVSPTTDLPAIESYDINVSTEGIHISSATVLGTLHAFQTLFQLPDSNSTTLGHPFKVSDTPLVVYRALLLDTTRSVSRTVGMKHDINRILETIDKMEAVKLNVLHWHLTDTDGLSFSYGNVTVNDKYTQNDLKKVEQYAYERGIAVVPEVDLIGHSGQVWARQLKSDYYAAPGCRDQLNLDNKFASDWALQFMDDLMTIFGNTSTFALGNDEVAACGSTFNTTYQALNNQFSSLAVRRKRTLVTWADSILENGTYFDPAVVAVMPWKLSDSRNWTTSAGQLDFLVAKGFKVIDAIQNPWYLSSNSDPKDLYSHTPFTDVRIQTDKGIIGGMVSVWEPSISDLIKQTMWPNAALVAESLWSVRNESRKLDPARLAIISKSLDAMPLYPSSSSSFSLSSSSDITANSILIAVVSSISLF